MLYAKDMQVLPKHFPKMNLMLNSFKPVCVFTKYTSLANPANYEKRNLAGFLMG
jgi:hypothetical protein